MIHVQPQCWILISNPWLYQERITSWMQKYVTIITKHGFVVAFNILYLCHNAPVTLHVYTPLLIWIKYLVALRPQYSRNCFLRSPLGAAKPVLNSRWSVKWGSKLIQTYNKVHCTLLWSKTQPHVHVNGSVHAKFGGRWSQQVHVVAHHRDFSGKNHPCTESQS